MENVRNKLITLLVRHTNNTNLQNIGDDTTLDSCGLDSLSLVHFVLEVEKEFNFKIPDSMFSAKNFDTIGDVIQTIELNQE